MEHHPWCTVCHTNLKLCFFLILQNTTVFMTSQDRVHELTLFQIVKKSLVKIDRSTLAINVGVWLF